MAPISVPQSTIDEIRDEIMAKIKPVLDDAISQAAITAVQSIPNRLYVLPSAAEPDLNTAHWIWTNEQPYNNPPSGARAFRKVEIIPSGEFVDSMLVDFSSDWASTLYVNDCAVGNGASSTCRFSIKFPSTNRLVIAAYAFKYHGRNYPCGLIASAVVWNSVDYQGRMFGIRTDDSWETSITAVSQGFEKSDYNQDSSWNGVHVHGPDTKPHFEKMGGKPTATKIATQPSGSNSAYHLYPPSAPLALPGPVSKAID